MQALTRSLEAEPGANGLLRQLARDIDEVRSTFRFRGGSWRESTHRLRIKLAVLGLSAPGATVASVAEAAGYSGTVAMGRAFRDAGIPAPSDVMAVLQSRN